MNEMVILVDENDREIGVMEKLEAHRLGMLHRAFSILVFNSKGELLLQKRAPTKYHSGGLWTNTCCSHPRPGEQILEAASRKLQEEMGFSTELTFSHKFLYRVKLDHQFEEHEWDYVLVGSYDKDPAINSHEACDWKYESLDRIIKDAEQNPHAYTYWFRIILAQPEIQALALLN